MRKFIFWILAIIITISSAIYQRRTGPTHPKRITVNFKENISSFKLPRSGTSGNSQLIKINKDTSYTVQLNYRRYPIDKEYNIELFIPNQNKLEAYLPSQSPAGKLEYFLSFYDKDSNLFKKTEPIIIRFKGKVPDWALIPHILFMFSAMLISNLAGIFAIGKLEKHVFYGKLTLVFLILGGFVFGPIVQYFAFGQAWTGIPLGWDLTDNKTLFAVLIWTFAVLLNRKSKRYMHTIIAAIVLLLIYIIPHSLLGSELDYSSGKVVTGIVKIFF